MNDSVKLLFRLAPAGVAMALMVFCFNQGSRFVRQGAALSVIDGKIKAIEKQEQDAKEAELLLGMEMEQLRKHEKQIPLVDGYIHLSRLLSDAASGLSFTLAPAEFSTHNLLQTPEYCVGSFRVNGSGEFANVRAALDRLSVEMPFARISEMHLFFAPTNKNRVDFSLSLQAVLRFNEESPSAPSTSLAKRP